MKIKYKKSFSILLLFLLCQYFASADLIYNPISFVISSDKESYYEGEKITLLITITNHDKERTLSVLLPHTQNTGQKLFYLSLYDKARNTMILRYSEDKLLKMMVHDTGTVKIEYLKPQQQIVIPIYLNDDDNYYAYHTQNASHHGFGIPLFAGLYQLNLTYNPKGIALGDSIYSYYDGFEKNMPATTKLPMSSNGEITPMIRLHIKRSADTIVSIARQKYYIKTDGDRYYYFNENVPKIVTDKRCIHISNLPPDSSSVKNEYFYSHFNELYAEYINRFDDGDIKEYRKFLDWCPSDLYTEAYNDFKHKILYALQLPDKRFYRVSYNQPGGSIHQETYCSQDGTLCQDTYYEYNKKGELVRKKVLQSQPCIEIELEGKKRSAHRAENLKGK